MKYNMNMEDLWNILSFPKESGKEYQFVESLVEKNQRSKGLKAFLSFSTL